jgi:probable HAF family extracellular repeat protein
MAPTARPNLGRRLCLAVAGAAVLTALTVATAGASPPTPMGDAAPMGIQAPAMTRPGASPSQDPTPSREASANTPAPGFLLDNGRYTSVAIPPRLAATAPWGITPTGINDRRQIVGEYVDDRLISRGFLIDQDGRYTRIDVPGALATNAAKINNRGQIVGVYSDTSPDLGDRPDSDPTAPTYKLRGFLLDKHGRFTRLDFPGSRSSQAFGINDRGQVVGEYKDSAGKFHGYVWERGRFTTIDVPGATATSAFGINNRGQILFSYGDDRSPLRGAVLSKGVFTRFDVPGVPGILPFGLNDRGQIVGVSGDPADPSTARGFLLAKGAKGPFTTISRPGAPVTVPTGINNRGQIVGLAEIPDATQGPQPTDTLPMSGMA